MRPAHTWRQTVAVAKGFAVEAGPLLAVSAAAPVPAGQGPGLETAYLQLVG